MRTLVQQACLFAAVFAAQPDLQGLQDPDPLEVLSFEQAMEILLADDLQHSPRPPTAEDCGVFVETGESKTRRTDCPDKWYMSGGMAGGRLHPGTAANQEDALARCRYGTIKQGGIPRRAYSELWLLAKGLKLAPAGADVEALGRRLVYHVRPHRPDQRSRATTHTKIGASNDVNSGANAFDVQQPLSSDDVLRILTEEFRQPWTDVRQAARRRPNVLQHQGPTQPACSVFIECPKKKKRTPPQGMTIDKWEHTRISRKEGGVVVSYGVYTGAGGQRYRSSTNILVLIHVCVQQSRSAHLLTHRYFNSCH
jgi:hypothetical protein